MTHADRVLVMGVLNVTPDSFSDGGRWSTADAALSHAQHLVAEGADLIDVGGESSRPKADMVLLDEDPDYLSIAPDLTFRSRTRVQDADTGEWRSETEIIESPSEICELLPAWMTPSSRKAGLSAASFSSEVSRRIPSSAVSSPSPSASRLMSSTPPA